MTEPPVGAPLQLAERRFYLYGYGVTNGAVAAALLSRGCEVTVSDDSPEGLARARADGCEVSDGATEEQINEVLGAVDAVVPTPGLPENHELFRCVSARGVAILSEFDVAASIDARPFVSITGTNGKTTVTLLATDMLRRSGRSALAVGNTEMPLVAAVGDPSIDVFVVEASSFRLAATRHFVPRVATWLNFAPDHLDVHTSLKAYEDAKLRSWTDLGPESIAVANTDDPVVRSHIPTGQARFVTFGEHPTGDHPHFRVASEGVFAPGGELLVNSSALRRSLPHDLSNIAAAAATVESVGATADGMASAAASFEHLAHRVETVAESDGIRWVDDSKATAPHATIAAATAFDAVVLIAGGRNKGLDLGELAVLRPRLRGVVGLGEAGPEVVAALAGVHAVEVATMEEAVEAAAGIARAGDTVLLSPACASFDAYSGYAARGDHFRALVQSRLEER